MVNTPGHQLVRKVHNQSPNGQKKLMVTLTHLPNRPPVDIEFNDIAYSVSEGRKRGFKTILKAVNGKDLHQMPLCFSLVLVLGESAIPSDDASFEHFIPFNMYLISLTHYNIIH